ncbi:hypothetical protein J3Q64DRAFT_1646050 [Phycomyces blakesleeanus]|uniref:C2 domain-containing protein n=1 Tax=Phycomyces blakesleeanus TaxID=4837 RepID=A0ABR3ARR3_PHYBL
MSLLLTTTCDYALLVAIQQGRHFLPRNDDDVCIESKLELRLPEAVDDLILPTTIISTRPATIDPDGQVIFRTTLAYLVSTKLLSRLRTYNAHVLLTISTLSADCTRTPLGVVRLQLSSAKMVVQRHGQRQLHEVNRFVVDKGAWQPLPSREEQVKAGLFIVAMPDHYRSTSKATTDQPRPELQEPPPLKDPTTTTTTTTANTITKSTKTAKTLKSNKSTKTNRNRTTTPETPETPETSDKSNSSLPQPLACSTTGEDVLRYHQIGKGTSSYTFYFNIVHADHLQPLLRSSSRRRRGVDHTPFFTYAFLSKTVMCPASSFSSTHQAWQTCFHLRGHLYDIQEWLDDQCRLQLSLVLMDANDATNPLKKDTVGVAQVPLAGLAFESPFLSSDPYNQPSRQIAKVTVRLGLVSGWWSDHTDADPWDSMKNKKVRHLSTSTATTNTNMTTSTSTTATTNTLDSGRPHQALHSILNSRYQPRKKAPYLHT